MKLIGRRTAIYLKNILYNFLITLQYELHGKNGIFKLLVCLYVKYEISFYFRP
jgi:hypothetical protein